MDVNVGVVGEGPAVEAFRAALADVDASVRSVEATNLGSVDFGAVVGTVGDDAFSRANEAAVVADDEGGDEDGDGAPSEGWVAVELGGVGGHPIAGVDAAVAVFAGDAGCHDCLRRRVASNLDEGASAGSGEGTVGSEATADGDGPAGVDSSAARFAGAVAGRRAVRLLSGEALGGTVVEVPGPEREFLPAPNCTCGEPVDRTLRVDHRDVSLDDALSRAERALDDRVGAVSEVGERESFPVPYYLARVADTRAFGDARAAQFAAGADPDWDRAFVKALGEALERYAAGVYRTGEFTRAAESDLLNAVSPSRFVRPAGAAKPDPSREMPWVEGRDLASGANRMLPAEFVQFPPPEERHKPAITTGLGLGNSTVEALLSGLYEVVERDATMLAWYSTFEPLGLTVAGERFRSLVGRARAEELTVTPLLVTQDVDVPVVAVAVHREGEWPNFAMGSAADLDAVAAARSALAEALQNWTELRAMGPEQASTEEAAIGEYADFPEAAREFVATDGEVRAADLGGDPVSGTAELRAVVDRVADADLDAYAARLTTRDLDRLGFEAVRVLSPAAQPLFTGEPFFGDRAREVPASMGFEARLDRAYHPFP
ncbi:YcaO-like family protein [Halobium salinum]|uniref:YcaO-like family protein n=1 Tax=Halobium salinum TaxID=1364940 RepID=A0ABD5PDL9_9EURY|nr:YcaO-like family protein [Halobium salinum]